MPKPSRQRTKIKEEQEKLGDASAVSPGVQFGGLEHLIGYQIRRSNGRSIALWEALLVGRGVAWGQYSILKILSVNPGLVQKEIAAVAGVDPTTVVPVFKHLEKAGLIERTRSAVDARQVYVTLSKQGEKLLKRVDPLVQVHDRELTSELSLEERQLLLNLLAKISKLPVTARD
jgi:DNA-binding MarR family transcriptional regulator